MHHIVFGDRPPPGSTGGAHSAPQILQLDLGVGPPDEKGGEKKEGSGRDTPFLQTDCCLC